MNCFSSVIYSSTVIAYEYDVIDAVITFTCEIIGGDITIYASR